MDFSKEPIRTKHKQLLENLATIPTDCTNHTTFPPHMEIKPTLCPLPLNNSEECKDRRSILFQGSKLEDQHQKDSIEIELGI